MIWGNKSMLWKSENVKLRRKFLSCTKKCMQKTILTSKSSRRDQRLFKQRSRVKGTVNWAKPNKTSQPSMKRVSTWKMNWVSFKTGLPNSKRWNNKGKSWLLSLKRLNQRGNRKTGLIERRTIQMSRRHPHPSGLLRRNLETANKIKKSRIEMQTKLLF